ncbi:hypothetical protein [Arthrobacter bambusae]|uniref:hypothetical protein n=1 Tax=Arthrobacter bambusae TaxID=1338426 RepID=UPI00277EBF07|nr:hypothetical protein [Arthrobacter bambusae]MDQ0241201.1 hypothetical protein [Arthrobacter bambusae]
MTHVKLPAGYEDWVESDYPGEGHERLRILVDHFPGEGYGTHKQTRYFVPPKPKPVLPKVRPGAVITYRDRTGLNVRAVYRSAHVWDTYRQTATPLNFACTIYTATDSYLLEDVNPAGFTLELDGL